VESVIGREANGAHDVYTADDLVTWERSGCSDAGAPKIRVQLAL